MYEKDSWGTVTLPDGQRKEVWREGDKIHVREPGKEIHTTIPLNDFLGALVVEMDKKVERPMHGNHLVEAIKMSPLPFVWKFGTYMFYVTLFALLVANIFD